MEIEQLSTANLNDLVRLILELWPDCVFNEEYENYERILNADNEICYLIRDQETYIAFIHLTIRTDYVEGTTEFPVAYMEAVYVKPAYQKLGIGETLVRAGENWGRRKGCRQLASDTELTNSIAIDFHRKIGFEEVNRIVCFVRQL